MVEQCFRKAEVVGSIPTFGSRKSRPPFFATLARLGIFIYTIRALIMENPQNPKETKDETKTPINKWEVVGLAWDLGFIIALPLLGFVFLGKWLDQKVGNETQWYTLAAIPISMSLTTVWLVKKLKKYIK